MLIGPAVFFVAGKGRLRGGLEGLNVHLGRATLFFYIPSSEKNPSLQTLWV